MRAELRWIWCADVDSLDTWRPREPDFSLPICLMAGPAGGAGEESFEVTLCSGGWLASRARELGIVDARHHLVVDEFNWAAIRRYLERRVGDCVGDTWGDVAGRLSLFARWEFEDYYVLPDAR